MSEYTKRKPSQARRRNHTGGLRWFRMHTKILDNADIQLMDANLFRVWVNMLCLAAESGDGTIPPLRQAAFRVRMDEHVLSAQIDRLIDQGHLIVGLNGVVSAKDWQRHQYRDPNTVQSAERMRRYRERKRARESRNADETELKRERETSQLRNELRNSYVTGYAKDSALLCSALRNTTNGSVTGEDGKDAIQEVGGTLSVEVTCNTHTDARSTRTPARTRNAYWQAKDGGQ